MAQLILLYLLLAFTGVGLTSTLRLRAVLDNVLMVFTFGAAQLMVSIQMLSLFSQLTPLALLVTNALATIGAVLLTWRGIGKFWKIFRTDLNDQLEEIRTFKWRGLALVFIAAAAICLIFQTVTAWLMYPMSDIYHFAMPQFWKQNQTILPFPVYDPRLIGVVFLSEALCLPGYMYAQTAAMFPLVSGLAAVLVVFLVIAMARHIGATMSGALCAGALIVGYGPMASLLGAKADMLASAMWFGASIHFLLRTRSPRHAEGGNRLIGCSVFCFFMACGAKNAVLMLIPVYAASLLLVCGRRLLSKQAVVAVFTSGALGLLASGVIWSYASNLCWFGDPRGPQFLKETLSSDLQPQAVWTRLARGTVMIMSDMIWLPGSCQKTYADFCQHAVKLLGGRELISDDNGFYSFRAEDIRPGTSFGLLGSTIFVPSLVIAAGLSLRIPRVRSWVGSGKHAKDVGVLVLLTIGSLVTYHALLRWQMIGISRLMLPCLVVGAPLAALLMEKSWLRFVGLPLLLGVMLAYSVLGFGLAVRRLAVSEPSGVAARISKLQRNHGITVEWKWQNAPVEKQEIKEGYTGREIVRSLLTRLPQPTTFGLIGKPSAEGYYLFGDGFLNKVISITDGRHADRYLPPAPEVEFLVAENFEPSAIPNEILEGFEQLVSVEREGKSVLLVFRRLQVKSEKTSEVKINRHIRQSANSFLQSPRRLLK